MASRGGVCWRRERTCAGARGLTWVYATGLRWRPSLNLERSMRALASALRNFAAAMRQPVGDQEPEP